MSGPVSQSALIDALVAKHVTGSQDFMDDAARFAEIVAAEVTAPLLAENEALKARVAQLEGALKRAADVMEWLGENEPDCYGWNPPFPSTSPGIVTEAHAARTALEGGCDEQG